MDNRDTNSPAVNHLAPDSLQGLLVGALADAGIDIIAFDSDASVAFTTLTSTQEHRDALIQYARNHRDQASEGGRLLFTRDRKLFTLYPRKQDVGGHALDVFTVRHRRSSTVRPGIDWLNAENVRADFEQSAFGIIEGEAALILRAQHARDAGRRSRVWQRPDSRASLFERLPFPSAICSH